MDILVQLTDDEAERLREVTERFGMEPEELVRSAVDGLISSADADEFERAADYVSERNAELYRRLSR